MKRWNGKYNILICHAKLGAGGIETACITQIREFSRRGYKIYVLAESGFYAEKLKQINGVTFIDFKYESRESYNLEKIENVTYQDIVDVCQNIELDTIFLLKGRNE